MAVTRFQIVFVAAAVACFAMAMVEGRSAVRRQANNDPDNKEVQAANKEADNGTRNAINAGAVALTDSGDNLRNLTTEVWTNPSPSNVVNATAKYWAKAFNISNTYIKKVADSQWEQLDGINRINRVLQQTLVQGAQNFGRLFG